MVIRQSVVPRRGYKCRVDVATGLVMVKQGRFWAADEDSSGNATERRIMQLDEPFNTCELFLGVNL